MCDIMERRIAERTRERDLETAKKMISLGKNSFDDISKILGLPLSTVEELASSMQKKDRA